MQKTLGQMIEESQSFDGRKEDYRGYSDKEAGASWDFEVTDHVEIMAVERRSKMAVAPMPMTEHALGQLVEKVGIITPRVAIGLRDNEGTRPHLGRAINELLQQNGENARRAPLLVRSYEGRARAVLSTLYANTPNTELLQLCSGGIEALGSQSGSVIDLLNFPMDRSVVTPDALHAYVSVKDINTGGGEWYKIGFMATNSEIGSGGLRLSPFIQRTSCTNSLVMDGNLFYAIHRGTGRALLGEFAVATGNALKLSFEGLQDLIASRNMPIDDVDHEIAVLAERLGWTTEVVAAVGAGTEGSHTVWGITMGMSAAAHRHFEDPEMRLNLEREAGRYMATKIKSAATHSVQ